MDKQIINSPGRMKNNIENIVNKKNQFRLRQEELRERMNELDKLMREEEKFIKDTEAPLKLAKEIEQLLIKEV